MPIKQRPYCPGCGQGMVKQVDELYYGGILAWYECRKCGWKSPVCRSEDEAYEKVMERSYNNMWCDVRNRLPVNPGYCLVVCEDKEDRTHILYFNGKTWSVDRNHYHVPKYWIPMPEPPKEKG